MNCFEIVDIPQGAFIAHNDFLAALDAV